MMLRIFSITLCASFISPVVQSACTLTNGQPKSLVIAPQTITISADAEISTSTPVAVFDSPQLGSAIGYNDCQEGTESGKRVQNLTGQDTATKIYQTNISGIGIRLLYSNGSAFDDFPSTSILTFPNGEKTGGLDVPAHSFYRIQFFKTGNLKLNNPAGDTILPAGTIAYNYIQSTASRSLSLDVGEMKVISTPACTADNSKTIDFNTVTPALLKAGVTRDLNFAITCKSDYGRYSATASMTTTTPSTEGSYILVKDATNRTDKLRIRITDSSNKLMKVDGTTSETKNSITSQGPAEFSWKATLLAGEKASPAGGNFSTKAEIVFDIN